MCECVCECVCEFIKLISNQCINQNVSVLLSIQYIMTCIPVAAVVVSVYPSSPFLSSVDDHSLLHTEIIPTTMLQCSCCLSLNISSSAIHHYILYNGCLLFIVYHSLPSVDHSTGRGGTITQLW